MRVVFLFSLAVVAAFVPSRVEAQSPSGGWDFGAGPHLIRRETSSHLHTGGGVTVARGFGPLSGVFEAGGTRREGHNDWRLIAGPRLGLLFGARSTVYVQTLAGVLIRQRTSAWALMPGVGVDMAWASKRAIRIQVDAPIERAQARTVAGVRASVWLVFYSRPR